MRQFTWGDLALVGILLMVATVAFSAGRITAAPCPGPTFTPMDADPEITSKLEIIYKFPTQEIA